MERALFVFRLVLISALFFIVGCGHDLPRTVTLDREITLHQPIGPVAIQNVGADELCVFHDDNSGYPTLVENQCPDPSDPWPDAPSWYLVPVLYDTDVASEWWWAIKSADSGDCIQFNGTSNHYIETSCGTYTDTSLFFEFSDDILNEAKVIPYDADTYCWLADTNTSDYVINGLRSSSLNDRKWNFYGQN